MECTGNGRNWSSSFKAWDESHVFGMAECCSDRKDLDLHNFWVDRISSQLFKLRLLHEIINFYLVKAIEFWGSFLTEINILINTQFLLLGHQSFKIPMLILLNLTVFSVSRNVVIPNTLPILGFPSGSAGKESACNAGDLGSIPELGRSPGKGNCYPLLKYSGLENSMYCIIHGVAKCWTWLTFTVHFGLFPLYSPLDFPPQMSPSLQGLFWFPKSSL